MEEACRRALASGHAHFQDTALTRGGSVNPVVRRAPKVTEPRGRGGLTRGGGGGGAGSRHDAS
jgi:hypothetical protein